MAFLCLIDCDWIDYYKCAEAPLKIDRKLWCDPHCSVIMPSVLGSTERAYWFHLVLRRCRCRRCSSLYLFFSKSLPLLFQSVDREVNKNTQWKFWNFLTTFKVFRPKNWKIVKNFKIELVPQFCLDPKDI